MSKKISLNPSPPETSSLSIRCYTNENREISEFVKKTIERKKEELREKEINVIEVSRKVYVE